MICGNIRGFFAVGEICDSNYSSPIFSFIHYFYILWYWWWDKMHTVLFISGWEIMYKIFRLCSKVPTHINSVFMILCQTIQAVKSMPVKQLQNLLCILKGSANINPHPNFLNFLKKKRKVQKGRKRTNCVCQLNNAVRRDFEIPNCSCSLCLENLKLWILIHSSYSGNHLQRG